MARPATYTPEELAQRKKEARKRWRERNKEILSIKSVARHKKSGYDAQKRYQAKKTMERKEEKAKLSKLEKQMGVYIDTESSDEVDEYAFWLGQED